MKTASIRLKLNKLGSNVFKQGVTPAEVALLVAEHHTNVGDNPVTIESETEVEVERSPINEIQRLLGKYNVKKVKALYPSVTANVPEDWDTAFQIGMGASLPTAKLMEHDASN